MGAWRFSRWLMTLALVLLLAVAGTLLATAYLGARQALSESADQQHDQQKRILERVITERFDALNAFSRDIAGMASLVAAVEAGQDERVAAIIGRRLGDSRADHLDALVVEGRALTRDIGVSRSTLPLERLSEPAAPLDTWGSQELRQDGAPRSLLRLSLPIVEPSLGRMIGRLNVFVMLDDGFWIVNELHRLFAPLATTLSHDGRLLDARRVSAEAGAAVSLDGAAPHVFTPEGVLHRHFLRVGDSDRYRVGLLMPDEGVLALRDTYVTALIYAILLVAVVGLGLMLVLRRMTMRSLGELVRYAETVPESGRPMPFRGGRFEEFNRVGQAFETMLQRIRERDKYLDGIIQHAPDLIFVRDLEGRYRLVNRRYAWALRATPEMLAGTRVSDWVDDMTGAETDQSDRRLLADDVPLKHHLSLETPDGVRHYQITKFPIRDDHGRAYLIGGVAADVTDLHQTQEQLQLSQQVFAETGEAIVVLDVRQRVLLSNRAFSDMSGHAPVRATAVVRDFLLGHPELQRALEDGRRWQGQCEFEQRDGTLPVLVSAAPLSPGKEGRRQMLLFSDISSLKVAEQRLERLAWYDALTGLANRSLFTLELDAALQDQEQEQEQEPVAVLFVDLDRFKDVNDRYGHSVGDELLRQAAQRLCSCVQARDTVARFGGDEFSVLLRGISRESTLMSVARRILGALSEPYELGVARAFSHASVGISLAGRHGDTSETLIRNADQAMYEAKARGREQAVFFESAIDERHQERLRVEMGLRQALAKGELRMYYQPRYDISGGRMVGAEALMRWHSPVHGTVPPGVFIPLAEHTGMIVELGRFALDEACLEAAGWADIGPAVPVSVNLSPRQLHAAELIRDIHVALHAAGLPPRLLELEITETHVIDNIDRVLPVLHQIRAMGVRLAIDDFGTGYSSLTYLKRLPVELLKIDRSFLADVPGDADDETLLAAIIDMAHALGFRVLAEGVETDPQRRFLEARGCDELQGFLLGRPLPADSLRETLARSVTSSRG